MWSFQVSPESRMSPRNFVDLTMSRDLPSIFISTRGEVSLRGGPKTMTCVLSTFKESRLALNQSMRRGSSEFIRDAMSCRLGPEENTLESSANIIVDILFEMVPRSLI